MAEGIKIKVIGVGGAGCNSVNNMFKEDMVWGNVDYIKLDDAELYQQQAKEIAAGTDMAVVIAGLGGYMGSKVTPVVIKDLKGSGAFVIAVTFLPFDFEGTKRCRTSRSALQGIVDLADAAMVLDNNLLMQSPASQGGIKAAFSAFDTKIVQLIDCIKSSADEGALVRLTPEDIKKHLEGKYIMETTFGCGKDNDAVISAIRELFYNNNAEAVRNTDSLLIKIEGGYETGVGEAKKTVEDICQFFNDDADVHWGFSVDPDQGDEIAILAVLSRSGDASAGRSER